jgi:hypothetical protein
VIGGSVSALGVTFFLLPTAYVWLERRKVGMTGRREDGKELQTAQLRTARPPVLPSSRPAEEPT